MTLYSYGPYIGMAYVVMAYVVMTYVVMPYIVMAYVVMTYIVMACVVMACIVIADDWPSDPARSFGVHRRHASEMNYFILFSAGSSVPASAASPIKQL